MGCLAPPSRWRTIAVGCRHPAESRASGRQRVVRSPPCGQGTRQEWRRSCSLKSFFVDLGARAEATLVGQQRLFHRRDLTRVTGLHQLAVSDLKVVE